MTQPPESNSCRLTLLNWELLHAINELEGATGPVPGSTIAERVGVPARSIGSRLRSLVGYGLIWYVADDRGWCLTDRGAAVLDAGVF